MSFYTELEARFKRLAAIGQATGMLNWDAAVMMPSGGAESRAEQIAALVSLRHELMCHPDMGALFDGATREANELNQWEAANLREMQRGGQVRRDGRSALRADRIALQEQRL